MSTPSTPTNDDEAAASQLQQTLSSSLPRSPPSLRPILTHLNADTTWLISIPIPIPSTHPSADDSGEADDGREGDERGTGRVYYHILIDPWLKGSQSDVAAFFSRQWHAIESSVQSISEVEDVIRGIEGSANGSAEGGRLDDVAGVQDIMGRTQSSKEAREGEGEREEEKEVEGGGGAGRWIDLVLISHEFTDHMHRPTLLELSPCIPIYATTKASSTISSWKHFKSVNTIPRFERDWRDATGGGKGKGGVLPDWLGVSRVAKAGADLLYYHSGIMICFPKVHSVNNPNTSEDDKDKKGEEAEAIIYTPHGIDPLDLTPLTLSSPKIHTLALLHGLQDISISSRWKKGAQLNKGAHNGLKVQRMLGARWWVGTHDEVKRGGGVVSWFLDRRVVSVEEAVRRAEEEDGEEAGEGRKGKGGWER